MLELLNITPIRKRLGISLSGGERRRCEWLEALLQRQKFFAS